MKSFKNPFSTFVHSVFIFALVFSLSSCKDDEDESPPRITIESPFENQIFSSLDSIEAAATITDNEQITSVELEILDLEFNQVAVRQSYPASGSTFSFGQLFPINQPQLLTGDYYLAFRANDGSNVGSAFVKIKINAIPRVLEGVLVLTSLNNQSYVYYREADENDFELEHNFFADAVGGGLNYRQNILATAGGLVGNADFFELEEFGIVNSLPGFGNNGIPFYLSTKYDAKLEQFFLTDREGRIQVFDKSTFLLRGFDGLQNHLPLEVFGTQNGYFLSEKEMTGPNFRLTSYSYQGLLFTNHFVSGEVKGVFDRNFNEKYVWIDDPEGLEMRILNETTEFLSLPYQRLGARLKDVVQISSNGFVISTSDGLFRYTYSNGGTVILDSTAPEGDLYFNDLDQLIYLITGHQVRIYALSGVLVGELSFPQDIRYVGFDYNR